MYLKGSGCFLDLVEKLRISREIDRQKGGTIMMKKLGKVQKLKMRRMRRTRGVLG